jgi:AraC-like DNA-binding protein
MLPPQVDAMVDEYAEHTPSPALRPYLASCSGYRQAGMPPGTHRGLPSPYLTMVITIDDPIVMAAHPDPAQRPGSYATLVGGLHARPALITVPGRQSGVFLGLHPLGARRLLGIPAGELADRDVGVDQVAAALADELQGRIRDAATWPQRFAAVEAVLGARLAAADRVPAPAPELAEAWRILLRSGGGARVDRLAERTGWSARHLGARFRAEIGLTPKTAARVIRFDRARRAFAAAPGGDLARIAAGTGYFDQAHLARDFRAFAGCSATAWLAAEGSDPSKPAAGVVRHAGPHDRERDPDADRNRPAAAGVALPPSP